MKLPRALSIFFSLLFLLVVTPVRAQGPPFQTDDPIPVDFCHYEFYIFGATDGTPVETDFSGPAFEFNWGAIPRVQVHAVLPFVSIHPSNNPIYLPSGQGSSAYGLGDMELGAKIAFIKETKNFLQIGSFTMFEIPTGDADKGLGIGKVWYKLPLWAQKNIGKWTLDGGAGYQVVPQTGFHNFPYGGFLLKREFSEKFQLAAEVFSHGSEGTAPPQIESSTMMDAGGYYQLKGEGIQLLFAYGHSIAGQTENYGYLGLYWTWGKDDQKNGDQQSAKEAMVSGRFAKNGF